MNRITVYTAITGGKDYLRTDQNFSSAKFVAFVEPPPGFDSKNWEIRNPYSLFKDPRRNARIHKILTHQYIESEYSIWMDGIFALRVPAEELIKFLNGCDIAMFEHNQRDCLFDEASVCISLKLDDEEKIKKKVNKYRKEQIKEHNGLFETGIVVRRHTKKIEELNNLWWSELSVFSRRDQISLNYAIKKLGIQVNRIPGSMHWDKNSYAYMGSHTMRREDEK